MATWRPLAEPGWPWSRLRPSVCWRPPEALVGDVASARAAISSAESAVPPGVAGDWVVFAQGAGDLGAQDVVDLGQVADHPHADVTGLDLAQLELQRLDDVLLLGGRHAVPEQPGLAVVVAEALAAGADLGAVDLLGEALEAARVGDLVGRVAVERGGGVGDAALVDRVAHVRLALVVVGRRERAG